MTIFISCNDNSQSLNWVYFSILIMLWVLLLLIILLLVWLLFSPLEFNIDSRIPMISVRWKSIGNAILSYENNDWWLNIQVLFFSKQWNVEQMISTIRKKKKKMNQPDKEKKIRKSKPLGKFLKILKTFEIVEWQVSFSKNDNAANARWYWLNYFPLTINHVRVNFFDENYLVLVIRNVPWQIAYAFIK